MVANKDKLYLKQRYNKWSVVVEIPKALREGFGVSRFIQSLGTDSLAQANVMKWPYVDAFKQAITQAKKGNWIKAKELASKAKGEVSEVDALAWRKELKCKSMAISGRSLEELRESDEALELEALHVALGEMAEKIERKEGLAAAKTFHKIATGISTPTMTYVDQWLAEQTTKQKTKDSYRSILETLSETVKTLEEVNRKVAGAYQSKLLAEGFSVKGSKAKFSAIRGYWDWLISKGHLDENLANPWNDHKWPKEKKPERKRFSDEDLINIFKTLEQKGRAVDLDLCRIAVFTGLRIDEITSIKLEDVKEDSFNIPESKTEAGVREVPIHSALKPTFNKLIEDSKDGYLLSGLSPNKYGDRSNAVGKRVNRMLHELGFTSRTQKFHSFRATLAKKFKEAKVEEEIAADIVGHELRTMTYGYYAGHVELSLKQEAIEKLKFPQELMKYF